MNQNLTWIKLYRKLRDWGWYRDSNTKDVFLELLLTANTEDKVWQGIQVRKGQLITGRISLSKSLGISEQSVRTALTHLKSTNEITIKATKHYTLITVNNFGDYQQSTNKSTNNQPTTNQQLTTTKEYKNIRNKEEESKEKFLKLTDQDTKEVASKYQVTVAFVEKIKDQLGNYCESLDWNVPYKNFKGTLKMWVSRKLDEAPKSVRLKELRPDQIEDIRKNDKLSVYKKAGYDVSVLTMR